MKETPDHAHSDAFVAAASAAMATRRDELAALDADMSGARAAVELDQTRVGRLSRMDALQVQAMAQEQQRRRLTEIQRIYAALKRIADGEYGWCLKCGEAISAKRLEADYATPLCVDCAR